MKIALIVATDKNHGIGIDNQLPWKNKEEMDFFKTTTTGHIVLMGKNTYLSLPSPLSERENIVISKDLKFKDMVDAFSMIYPKTHGNVTVYSDLISTLEHFKQQEDERTLFIIGGKSIYEQSLPYCDEIYLSQLYEEYLCDTYFEIPLSKYNISQQTEFNSFTQYVLTPTSLSFS